jgi:hypothetical protein
MKSKAKFTSLDEYSRTARLKPAFLVILPIGTLVSVLGLKVSALLALFSGPLATVGLTFLLTQIGRDFGKRKEAYLYSLWSGKPSVTKMRHRDGTLNVHTRQRYHQKAALLLEISMPTATSEQEDPLSADEAYEAYSNLLLEKTRDKKKFPLIFNELVNYGFRRNLWGLKPMGLTVASICLISQSAWILHLLVVHHPPPTLLVSSLFIDCFLLLCWIFLINPEWVRIAANAYAERLLASSEVLQRTSITSLPEETPQPRRRPKKSSAT